MRRWLAWTSVVGLLLVGCSESESGDQAEPADTTTSTETSITVDTTVSTEPAATVDTTTSSDTTAVDTTVSTEPAATVETATTPETTDDDEPLELRPPPPGAVLAAPTHSLVAAGAEDFGVDVDAQGELGWRIRDVAAGGPGFVAVGGVEGDAAVWTSPDGVTWTRVTDIPDTVRGGEDNYELGMVTTGGPGLVAMTAPTVGMGGTGPGEIAVLVSSDGLSWTDVAELSRDAIVSDVTAGGPGLVVAGHVPYGDPALVEDSTVAFWTSPDGSTWSQAPYDEAVFGDQTSVAAVAAGGPGLVAVGSGDEGAAAAVWTSPDGLTWTRVPHDKAVFGDAWMTDVIVGGPGLVAVGSSLEGREVWTSPDGVSWTRLPDEAFWPDQGPWGGPSNELVSMGSHLVIIDDEVRMWSSADGTTWVLPVAGLGGGDGSVIAAAANDSKIVVIVSLGDTPAIWNVTFEFHDIDRSEAISTSSRLQEGEVWKIEFDDAGPGIHTVFMITTFPIREADLVRALGGRLVWEDAEIELCGIGIRSVGDGFVRIGDIFQTTEGCGTNTGMQQAFDDHGLPETACVYVRADGVDDEYCAPLAID